MGNLTMNKFKKAAKANKALTPEELVSAINVELKGAGPTEQYKAIEPLVTRNIAAAKELVGEEGYMKVNRLIWAILDVYND